MKRQEERTTHRSFSPDVTLLRMFALLILLALLTVFVTSLPGYAAETDTEIWEKDGNVVLAPQAAKDLFQEIRALRAENEALRESLMIERQETLELITSVKQLQEEVQKERRLSQETISRLRKDLKRERQRTQTVGIIGGVLTIFALAL